MYSCCRCRIAIVTMIIIHASPQFRPRGGGSAHDHHSATTARLRRRILAERSLLCILHYTILYRQVEETLLAERSLLKEKVAVQEEELRKLRALRDEAAAQRLELQELRAGASI